MLKRHQVLTFSKLSHEWEIIKALQLGDTALPSKVRELIGIGISSATGSIFGLEYHIAAAKLAGASDEEVSEAVWFAKQSVGWSTYFNGTQYDRNDFRDELQKIVEFVWEKKSKGAAA